MKTKYILRALLVITLITMHGCSKDPDETLEAENVEGGIGKGKNKPAFISNPKNLNIVYFIPTDNPEVADYQQRINDLLINFQNYIKSEMERNGFGNKTFGLPVDTATNRIKIIVIQGQNDQATYDYGSGSAIINEINNYKSANPNEFSGEHTLILLPQRTDGGSQPFYGWGRNCFAVDNPNIKISEIPSTSSNLIAGMLHELGHGLGLPHNKQKASEVATLGTALMGSGNYTWGRQPTFITAANCAILNRNQIFQNTITTDVYGSANTTISPSASWDSANETINVSGTFTSDKAVSDILYWLDPNVNNEGAGVNKDYNSVAWLGQIGQSNSFSIDLPVGEVIDHGDYPYELKIKLVLENGTVKTNSYSFEFVNGEFKPSSVYVYQHGSYGGWSVALGEGSYTTSDIVTLGGVDNDLSSVKVPLGLKVTLYDGDNFTGNSYVLDSGDVSFLSSFNDITSSIIVEPK